MKKLKNFINSNPSFTDHETIQRICAPLKEFGIIYFSYVHINHKHEMAVLMNYPEFGKFYFEQNYQQYDIHRLETSQKEHIVIWDHIERKNISKKMYEDFKAFGCGHTCTIIRKDESGRSYFSFAGNADNENINQFYVQNKDILYHFIQYFLDKISRNRMLSYIHKHRLALNPDEGEYELISMTDNIKQDDFYKQTQFERLYINQEAYLTKAEILCLRWLKEGKTMDEAGIILGLTQRTVKAHIQSAKEKLNCKNLFQLGAKVSMIF